MEIINWVFVLNVSSIVLGVLNIILAIFLGYWFNWLIGGWVIGVGMTILLHSIWRD